MDILSDVISAMRAGRPGIVRAEWHSPWGRRFPDDPGTAGFIVILQGSCWLLSDDADPVPISPGDVLFFPHGDGCMLADSPGTPLDDSPTGDLLADTEVFTTISFGEDTGVAPTVMLCGGYTLNPSWTHPLLRSLPATIHIPARVGRHPGLRAAVDILGTEIDGGNIGADAIVSVALDMLLLYILRAWFEEVPAHQTGSGWAAALADPAVNAALNAIHQDPARSWTVQDLAGVARLSRAAFSRRFSSLTGQPPMAYLTWWRLTVAADMLRTSDASLDSVAARVGYGSEFAFANAFKRQYGVAPGRYRRRSRGTG
ncbi:AraC family transcriptional regulator [Actinobacteria bacterium YIM 96077]|uniref:AraC family transcriptional regulator n=1 Tax=Phytoactinopolyspora halophila TaxID=1981511 RepID=A0A329QFJ1_9ACTN|nr:AraC family transcriptional regulator [Phytoactinopolyspora halophila]AYY13082.1 AraC family transcriptional regulator [Actinobacteria bacterium YIM 96077]RAW11094.1 AraC family transcriptional regulator [Phytoactinopolyspora halophila]